MTGTIINVISVLIGSAVGLFFQDENSGTCYQNRFSGYRLIYFGIGCDYESEN